MKNERRIMPEEAWEAYCLSRLEPAHNQYSRCIIGAISRVSGVPEGKESSAAEKAYGFSYSIGFGIFGVGLGGSKDSRVKFNRTRSVLL
jgi:hypothetical protein